MIQLVRLSVSFLFFSLAAYFDLKTGEIPPWTWWTLSIVGFALHCCDPDPDLPLLLFYSASSTFIPCLTLFYLGSLLKTDLLGGADVKLLTALALAVPFDSSSLLPFPLAVLVTALLIEAPLIPHLVLNGEIRTWRQLKTTYLPLLPFTVPAFVIVAIWGEPFTWMMQSL